MFPDVTFTKKYFTTNYVKNLSSDILVLFKFNILNKIF